MSYKIIRMYQRPGNGPENITGKQNLTLEQAQEHCRDPETSSSTCKGADGRARTKQWGEWFDGYQEN